MMAPLGPVTLMGTHVMLQPLRLEHAEGLLRAGAAPEIWTWLSFPQPKTLAEMEEYIRKALATEAGGQAHPFAVIELSSGRVVGTTRYTEIAEEHRTVEIGWTWYARDVWGTAVNPEAKYLLLKHAFETWGAMRVQFKADSLNVRSCNAILRLGARQEGILRNHRVRLDGTIRHSAIFSITDAEWPQVRGGLAARIIG